jgi:hypothetical protein
MKQAKKVFIEQCSHKLAVVLPTLLRIKEQKLILNGYQLNNNISMGLGVAFHEFTMMLRHITLSSNNLSDEGFAILLKGLNHQDHIESITYKLNEFGPLALQ